MMKSAPLVCAVTAIALSLGSLSLAQAQDRRDYGSYPRQEQAPAPMERQGDRHEPQRQYDPAPMEQGAGARGEHWRHERRDHGPYGHRERAWRGDEGPQGAYHHDYGARGPEFRHGRRIPPQYRSPQYVVQDWRAHRLSRPPRGHYWVQVGADYVLVAIATGLIVQVILGQ